MFPEPQQQKLKVEFEERCSKNSPEVYYKTFVTLMDWGLGDKLETHERSKVWSHNQYFFGSRTQSF